MLGAAVALAVAAAAGCSGGEAKSGPAPEAPGTPAGSGTREAIAPAAPAVSAPAFGPGVHDFTLPTSLGGPLGLRDYLGQKNVVLVFYRGFW